MCTLRKVSTAIRNDDPSLADVWRVQAEIMRQRKATH
jgi:hypothetical protein